jgi:hypothetical protein
MVKQISKYKGRIYTNEANYSAGILIADIWKETLDFKVGDILRVVHRGRKRPNRIHLERMPIEEKIRLLSISKIKNAKEGETYDKYIGSESFYLPIEQAIILIRKAFQDKWFSSRQLTYWVFWSEDFGIQNMMDSKEVDRFTKRYSTWEFLKRLCEKGYLNKKEKILNPIPDSLGRIKKTIYYQLKKGGLNSSQP